MDPLLESFCDISEVLSVLYVKACEKDTLCGQQFVDCIQYTNTCLLNLSFHSAFSFLGRLSNGEYMM